MSSRGSPSCSVDGVRRDRVGDDVARLAAAWARSASSSRCSPSPGSRPAQLGHAVGVEHEQVALPSRTSRSANSASREAADDRARAARRARASPSARTTSGGRWPAAGDHHGAPSRRPGAAARRATVQNRPAPRARRASRVEQLEVLRRAVAAQRRRAQRVARQRGDRRRLGALARDVADQRVHTPSPARGRRRRSRRPPRSGRRPRGSARPPRGRAPPAAPAAGGCAAASARCASAPCTAARSPRAARRAPRGWRDARSSASKRRPDSALRERQRADAGPPRPQRHDERRRQLHLRSSARCSSSARRRDEHLVGRCRRPTRASPVRIAAPARAGAPRPRPGTAPRAPAPAARARRRRARRRPCAARRRVSTRVNDAPVRDRGDRDLGDLAAASLVVRRRCRQPAPGRGQELRPPPRRLAPPPGGLGAHLRRLGCARAVSASGAGACGPPRPAAAPSRRASTPATPTLSPSGPAHGETPPAGAAPRRRARPPCTRPVDRGLAGGRHVRTTASTATPSCRAARRAVRRGAPPARQAVDRGEGVVDPAVTQVAIPERHADRGCAEDRVEQRALGLGVRITRGHRAAG